MECQMRFLVRIFYNSQVNTTKDDAHNLCSILVKNLRQEVARNFLINVDFQELSDFPELSEAKYYHAYDFSYYIAINSVEKNFHPSLIPLHIVKCVNRFCYNQSFTIWIKFLELQGFWVNPNQVRDSSIKIHEFHLGSFILPNKFISHYAYTNDTGLCIDFCHDQQKIRLNFVLPHSPACRNKLPTQKYRFLLDYAHISKIIIDNSGDKIRLYVTFFYPPLLFQVIVKRLKHGSVTESRRETSFGCTSCLKYFCPKEILGQSCVLALILPEKGKEILERLRQLLESSVEFIYCQVNTIPEISNIPSNDQYNLCFKCRYAWMSVYEANFNVKDQVRHNLNSSCLSTLGSCEGKHQALQRSLFYISSLIQNGEFFDFNYCLKHFYEEYSQDAGWNMPQDLILLPKIIMTPYRKIYLPFQQHALNRILRRFGKGLFLLVSLREENLEFLHSIVFHGDYNKFVEDHFGKEIKSGITIGSYRFKFLASSTSQVRDHGFYMYCAINGSPSTDDIRRWIQFDNISGSISKKMARMGQCFSSLEAILPLDFPCKVETVPDIKNGPYTFTDGIGMVSSDIADRIRKLMTEVKNHPKEGNLYKPSAFQIRYHGYKGMLVENNELEPSKIVFRDSMKKFVSGTTNDLEVVKISAPRQLFLNQFLITILEYKKVKRSAILELQEAMVLDLAKAMMEEDEAEKLLALHVNKLHMPISQLRKVGFVPTSEPFLRSLMLAAAEHLVGLLRSKARISIPPEYGRNMLGVIDETGILQEDEVFLQISEKIDDLWASQLKVLTGWVIVTKNPGLHPGDVRLVKAVDVPRLHHIRDCIVFSQQGLRPLTDQIAGSDLDGDEYVVFWHPKLFFSENTRPMNYPSTSHTGPSPLVTSSQADELVDFILSSIKFNKVGILSNAFLAYADLRGIDSLECQQIIAQFPYIVDFIKSGVPPQNQRFPNVKQYPDFMQKRANKNSYRSKNVLGQLYRSNRALMGTLHYAAGNQHRIRVTPDPMMNVPGWIEFAPQARHTRDQYGRHIQFVLDSLGLKSETELFSGHFRNQRLSQKERERLLACATANIRYIKILIVQEFYNFVGSDRERLLKLASAWYNVTYGEESRFTFRSFPWIIARELCEVRNHVVQLRGVPIELVKSHLRSTIEEKTKSWTGSDPAAITFDVLWHWICSFQKMKHKEACRSIFTEIFEEFLNQSPTAEKNVGSLVIGFLCWAAGKELRHSHSRRSFKQQVHWVALKNFAALAFTHDLTFIGLEKVSSYVAQKIESDPLRVPFSSIYHFKIDTFKQLLIEWTGLDDLLPHLGTEDDDKECLILIGIGTEQSIACLEEIVLHPNLIDALCHGDLNYLEPVEPSFSLLY